MTNREGGMDGAHKEHRRRRRRHRDDGDRDGQHRRYSDYDHHEYYTPGRQHQDRYLNHNPLRDLPPRESRPRSPHNREGHTRSHQNNNTHSHHDMTNKPAVHTRRGENDREPSRTSTVYKLHFDPIRQVHSIRRPSDADRNSRSREASTSGVRERTRQPYLISKPRVTERSLHRPHVQPNEEDMSEDELVIVEDRAPQPHRNSRLRVVERAPNHMAGEVRRGSDQRRPEVSTSHRKPEMVERPSAPSITRPHPSNYRPPTCHDADEEEEVRLPLAQDDFDNVASTNASQLMSEDKTNGLKSALKQKLSKNASNGQGEVDNVHQESQPMGIHCEACSRRCSCQAYKALNGNDQPGPSQSMPAAPNASVFPLEKSSARKSVSFDLPSHKSTPLTGFEAARKQELEEPRRGERRGGAIDATSQPIDIGQGGDALSITNNTTAGGHANIYIYHRDASQTPGEPNTAQPATTTRDVSTATSRHGFHPFFRHSGC